MGDYDKEQADDQGGKGEFDKGQQSQDGADKQQYDDGKGKADDLEGGEKPQG